MKTRTLVIGGITVTALLAGGWALAQSVGPPSGFGPSFMRGQGHGGMGLDMMKGMHGKGMDHEMGPGMRRHGWPRAGMMKGMGRGCPDREQRCPMRSPIASDRTRKHRAIS